jgi:lipid II:glycine glycyltransferase (peptidoglycan interpeptide bridge formation enzyme)
VSPDVEALERDPATWDAFVESVPSGAYPQLTAWAEVKRANGWRGERVVVGGEAGPVGLQVLVRDLRPTPWRVGYGPRGPVAAAFDATGVAALTHALREFGRRERLVEIVVDPEVEAGHPLIAHLEASGWRPAPSIQTDRTRLVDLRRTEAEIWADLRSKWRQYVSKARRDGVTVEDAGGDGIDAFYEIYVETARRAGFVHRAKRAYEDVYRAYAERGRARLLIARLPDGTPAATLMLVRCGSRVVEPYGGMTQAGAVSRANYLLKWEAIRSSREAGAETYDMWGLAHPGIEQFKAGFGGREVVYAGARVLVLDRLGHVVLGAARRAAVAVARTRRRLRGSVDAGDDT